MSERLSEHDSDSESSENVTGAEKERGPTGTRTQGLLLTVRALYH